MKNFDAWLTTDRHAEEQQLLAELEDEAWHEHCEEQERDSSDRDSEYYREWHAEWELSLPGEDSQEFDDPRWADES